MSDKEFEELKAKDVCGLARTLYMLALNGYQTEDGYGYHENVPVDGEVPGCCASAVVPVTPTLSNHQVHASAIGCRHTPSS